jgi:hypothetical protein
MAARTPLFLVPVALLLVSAAVLAQTPSPAADVEQALRARVTEFFQDFVDGKFRQAINLVAEDTQDEYFSSPKAEIKTFKIDRIDFSSDFTKADVQMTVKQIWKLKAEGFLQDTVVESPMATTWKIENGKWVFYHHIQPDGWVTPMGPSSGFHKPEGPAVIPEKLDEATLNAEAARLLNQTGAQTGVDKEQVTLASDKPSSVKVVFHNGAQGSVNVSMVGVPNLLGFSAKFDKPVVNSGQDAILEIGYAPAADQHSPPNPFIVAVDVAPFGRLYPVEIDFAAPTK